MSKRIVRVVDIVDLTEDEAASSKRARHLLPVAPTFGSNGSGGCNISQQQPSIPVSSTLCNIPMSVARSTPWPEAHLGDRLEEPIVLVDSDDGSDIGGNDVDDKDTGGADDETDVVDESGEGGVSADADAPTASPAAALIQGNALEQRSCGATDSEDDETDAGDAGDDADTDTDTDTDRSVSRLSGTDTRAQTDARSDTTIRDTELSTESVAHGDGETVTRTETGTDSDARTDGASTTSPGAAPSQGTTLGQKSCGAADAEDRSDASTSSAPRGNVEPITIDLCSDTDDDSAAAGACKTVWHEKDHELIGKEVAHRFNKHGNKVFRGTITKCLQKQENKLSVLRFKVAEGFPPDEKLTYAAAKRAVAFAKELREAEDEAARRRQAEQEVSDLAQVLWVLGAKAHFLFASRAQLKRLLEADAALFDRLSPPPPPPPQPLRRASLFELNSNIAAAEAAFDRAEADARIDKDAPALGNVKRAVKPVRSAKRALRAAKTAKREAQKEQKQRWLFGLLDAGVAVRLDEHMSHKWWALGHVDTEVKNAVSKHSDTQGNAGVGSPCGVAEAVFTWLAQCTNPKRSRELGGELPDQRVPARYTLESWRKLATDNKYVRSMKTAAASGEPVPRKDIQREKLLHIPVPNIAGLAPSVTAPSWLTEANWLSSLADKDSTFKIKLQLAHAHTDTAPHRDNGGCDTWMRVLAGKVLVACWSHADALRHGVSEPEVDEPTLDVDWQTVVTMKSARLFLLKPGQTLLMPAGTVHYVYTVEEKAVIAGDVLTICGWERRRQSCWRDEGSTEHEKEKEVEELLDKLRVRVRAEAEALSATAPLPSTFRRECLKRLYDVARAEMLQLQRRGDKGGGDGATMEAMRVLGDKIAGW
mmetsp:Transcript_20273/g.42830  ORF Transcript_20273/g.42830 Transcript_20273/m.42830 type:complete len:876 (-) Transcript_20273:488-3115(-)